MTPKEIFLSPNAIFLLFYNVDMALDWRWILRTGSSQCHNNPVLVPPCKPTDPMNDIYDGQTYDLKTSVDIWTNMDVVPVEYGTFAQKLQLAMRFFSFLLGLPSSGIM